MSFRTKGFLSVLAMGTALAVAMAGPAEAKKRKSARSGEARTASTTQKNAGYRDQSLFPKGPIYFGNVYIGEDPDPFIRSQILRDAGAKFGGNE